ncbi:MAG TPA: hypothetical protein VFZ95_10025 [Steroidobacteraceae bacterium]
MKALKILGWLLLATFLLVVLLYLVLVAINFKDRPPSAAVLQFEQIVAARPAVAADDNAAVYILGFGAPMDADPVDVGTRRMAWLETFDADTDSATDPLPTELSFQKEGSPVVSHLANACGQDADRLQCASVFESMVRAWQPNDMDALALRRYEALLTRHAWRDVPPAEATAPMPAYSNVTHAQRLYLLRLAQWAAQGRIAEVRAGLDADFAFWRTAIPAADTLVVRLISIVALRQHFSFANLILSRLPADQAMRAVPDDWRREFSTAERSMKRVMAGEMVFWKGAMLRQGVQGSALATVDGPGAIERLTGYLTEPMFKLQATTNGIADRRLRLCEDFEVPMNQYLRLQKAWDEMPSENGLSLYNPVGNMILFIEDGGRYVVYALRTASVEGMRRAALLAFQLHANGLAPEAVGSLVEQSDLRDPYTEKPFEWNAERHSVTFTGPENVQSRRSEFFY